MKKILTITIPTYNVEKYLERCLISLTYDESILDKLEIIIVNDGSKDDSLKIAKKYEKKYPNAIIVVDKENGGHGSTINVGMEKATGKYFRVLDSDDWFNIDDFPKFVKKLEKLDVDMILTNFRKEYAYEGTSELFTYEKFLDYDKIYEFDKFDIKEFGNDYFYLATITYKTEVLKKANFKLDEKMFYVDTEYTSFPIPFIDTVLYLNYDIYRYYIGRIDQSVNLASYVRNRKHHDFVVRKLVKFYESGSLSQTKKDYMKNFLVLLLNTHYSIYCSMKVKDNAKKDIRSFDKFLKEVSPDLYNATNFSFIKSNRKTKFVFCQCWKRAYTKLAIKRYNRRNK